MGTANGGESADVIKLATVHGLRLAYREWPGRPGVPTVICVPHLTGHKGSFATLARALAPDYHVYAVDLRGRGDSDKPAEGYGFAYHARDLLGLADVLGLDSFGLIGHSFGATTAVYLASIQPGRVRALVLLDGGADPKHETLTAMYPTIRRLDQRYPSMDAYLEAMRGLRFYQPWSAAIEQYFREDVEADSEGAVQSKCSAPAIAHDLDMHFLYSMCLHFPHLHCPVLFVRPEQGLLGDRGHVLTPSEVQSITSHIPNCRRVDVPGVNHYTLLLHEASPIGKPVRGFLDEVLAQPVGRG